MPSEVILPRVDMDMATGKISRWLVEPGTAVVKGQPLFEIETDKAAMEIEAPATGTVQTLVDASAHDIPVGSVVAWIYAKDEASGSAVVRPPSSNVAPTTHGDDRRDRDGIPIADDATAIIASPAVGHAGARPAATPLARRLARDRGIDLATVTGSGPRGRIQAVDVDRAAAAVIPAQGGVVEGHPVLSPAPGAEDLGRPRPMALARAPGGALNIVALRSGTGAPIVLIHGWGADVNGWRPFLQGQRVGRPVLALDLPGHGASALGRVAGFDDLVDAVSRALADADLAGAHLVGHSLGGAIAAAAAARGGLDLASLLLLAPAGLGPSINGAFLRGYLAATSEASLTPWIHQLVADPTHISAAFVRDTLKARAGTALVDTQRQLSAAVFPDDTQAFSIRADLARLAIPTRVVFGTADRILPASEASSLPGLIASHRFPGVGHLPQIEVRDAVAAILAQMTGV